MKAKSFLLVGFCVLPMSLQAMEVDFTWTLANRCSAKSPKLIVTNIPKGTVGLGVALTDNNMGSWDHGGGWIKVEGQAEVTIPEGWLSSGYNGPCPPNFASGGHDYTFTVRAEGKENSTLATAYKTANFSSEKVK